MAHAQKSMFDSLKEDELLTQPHTSELTVVFTGGCPPRTGRSRRVPLSARKVETAATRCPVQRNRIKATRKEAFNATGEESTYQGTYTGVEYRSINEMPLIAKDDKLNILDPKRVLSPPTLPDEWDEKNGQDVPLYWQESKPIALWIALLDDWKVQAIMDLSPGSGALCEAALTRGILYHGLCQTLSSLIRPPVVIGQVLPGSSSRDAVLYRLASWVLANYMGYRNMGRRVLS